MSYSVKLGRAKASFSKIVISSPCSNRFICYDKFVSWHIVGYILLGLLALPFAVYWGLYAAMCLLWAVPCYQGPASDHFDGVKFHNLEPTPDITPWRFISVRLIRRVFSNENNTPEHPWPVWVDDPPQPPLPKRVEGLRVTFINHATLLIQINGLNILTDPHYSERASPVSWAGPKRRRAPGVRFQDLPPIDIVILSHNHYDHMDVPTLERLERTFHPRFVSALGNPLFLKKKGIESVGLDWGEGLEMGRHVKVHVVRARHFSARALNDRDNALWCGFVLSGEAGNIYFAGDTAYAAHFSEIGKQFAPIRLALLPIGAYLPALFMERAHISPEQAVRAAEDLHAQDAIPMHYGTFRLSDEGMDEPVRDLQAALALRGTAAPRFHVLKSGESWSAG
jgi:L-ascorbate metabolism protein UlaG (beta-lactamase superfamily)